MNKVYKTKGEFLHLNWTCNGSFSNNKDNMVKAWSKVKGFNKALKYFTYFTQIGLAMAVPILLSIWFCKFLQEKFQLGNWILLIGIVFGVGTAFTNLIKTLQSTLLKPIREKDEKDEQ